MSDGDEARAALLARADAEWQRYTGVIAEWPGELHGEGSGWRPADDFAHHARWLSLALERVQAHLERGATIEVDADEVNATWQAEDRGISLDDARRRCEAARDALIACVAALPAGRIDARTIEIVDEDLVGHLGSHLKYVRQAFMRDEVRAWMRLREALDAAGEGLAHREGPAWTVRDVWAHLARWMDHAARYVPAYVEGSPPQRIDDYDAVNARWQAEDASLSLDDARSRALAAHDRIAAVMRDTPAGRWDARVFGVFAGNTLGHYREHLEYMGLA